MGRQVRAGNGEGPLGSGRAASPALPRARAGCGGAARSLSAAQSGAGPPGVPGWCAAPAGERRRRQQRLPFPRRASSLPLPRRKSGGESRRVGGAGSAAARRRQPSGGGRGPRAGPCPAPAAGGPSHASPAGFGAGLLRETPAPGPGGRRRWRRAFGRAPAGGRSSEGGSGGGTPAGPSRSFPSPQGQVPSVRASAALPLASPGGSKAAKPGGGSKTRAARCDPPGLRAAARGGGCFQGGGSRSREAPGSPSPAPSSSLTRGAVPGRGSLCPPLSAVRPRRKSRPRCGRPRAVSPASKRAAPAGAKRAVSRAPSLAGVARPPAPAAAGSRPVAREGVPPAPPSSGAGAARRSPLPLSSSPPGRAARWPPVASPPSRVAPRSERRRRRSPLPVRRKTPAAACGRPGSGPDRRCPRRPFPGPRRARRGGARAGDVALPVTVRQRRAGERARVTTPLRAPPALAPASRPREGGPGEKRWRWSREGRAAPAWRLALSGGPRAVRVAGSGFRRCPPPARGRSSSREPVSPSGVGEVREGKPVDVARRCRPLRGGRRVCRPARALPGRCRSCPAAAAPVRRFEVRRAVRGRWCRGLRAEAGASPGAWAASEADKGRLSAGSACSPPLPLGVFRRLFSSHLSACVSVRSVEARP